MSTSREARYKRIAQQAKRQNKQLRAALAEAGTQLDEHEAKAKETEKTAKSNQALRKTLHRAAWDKAALDAGVDSKRLDDFYKLAAPELGDDDEPVDPREMAKHVAKGLKGREAFLTSGDDEEQETEEGDDEEQETEEETPRTVLDLLDKENRKPSKGQESESPSRATKGKTKDGDKGPLGKTKERSKPESAPRERLSRGEGAGKGGRHDRRETSMADIVDRDFEATGRDHPSKL